MPLILLAIALSLGAFVYFYEVKGKPQREAAQAQTEQLFTFKEQDVRSLTLTTPTQTLAFAKTPAAQLSSVPKADSAPKTDQKATAQPTAETLVWAMTQPDKAAANDASIAYLLNLLTADKRQQTLKVPAAKLAEFGLDKPIAIAEVKLANQTSHRLLLGKPNFNRSGLYAQVDPPAQANGDRSVVLVSTDFENAVQRSLPEWKAKPTEQPAKPKTPTPEPQKP
ncbi:DUF4340 domain-containing protein [Leptolyngbya sp. FACHB-321]|uniref:DUF4340 domain-containing protein n=1 Tax=Leptolyngbya sp. FACHB-321 TaxID=2692807 RepID=UPI001F5592F9|nr:DUF4340 domain-containing protein [Leptolyngbya sp. FACHB-321]